MMKNIIRVLIGLFVIATSSSHAFKVDTHVWVGQQVINDLEDDGKLTIKLDGKSVDFIIPTDVKNAILSNKAAYLMGNIGPDAVPDAVVGQVVIHPGVENEVYQNIGWKTNKWLEYLLANSKDDPTAKAFAYGFVGHAAADTFAHTYVNQYAGDIFRIFDNETLVEQRHIILEGFISKFTPPLKDWQGNPIDKSWQNIVNSAEYIKFVKEKLIYNAQVQGEYKKVPGAGHLVAVTEFKKGIHNLAGQEIWHDIDVLVAQIVAACFDIQLTKEEAAKLVNELQPVMPVINEEIPDAVQDANRDFYRAVARFDAKVFKNLTTAVDKMKSSEEKLLSKHQDWRRKLTEILAIPGCPKIPVPYTKCKWYGCYIKTRWVDDPVCKHTRQLIADTNELTLSAVESLEDQLFELNDSLRRDTIAAHTELSKAMVAVQEIHESITDFAQVFGTTVSPIQSYLLNWEMEVDLAIDAYVTAASQTMLNTMDPNTDPTQPLRTWFDCYGKSMIGAPIVISGCKFKANIAQIKKAIDTNLLILDRLGSLGTGLPGPHELKMLQDQLMDDLTEKLKDEVGEALVDKYLPDEVKELVDLFAVDVNDTSLNHFFTKPDQSQKGLVMIGDMASRVRAEMHEMNGVFDPNEYAVIYNAVVLAKLALVDWYNFESLAIEATSTDYQQYRGYLYNIVAQSLGSIDGNHQWMPTPPPYPRMKTTYSTVNYSYSSLPDDIGFVLWSGDMRDKIFRKVFKGPISPGIDSPSVIGMSNLPHLEAYPYRPCSANPFPDDIKDKKCVLVWLIPILSGLLN
jgi:hypothetical protein